MKILLSSTDLFDYPWVRLLILLTVGLIVLLYFIYYVIRTLRSKPGPYERQVDQDLKVSDDDPFS